MPYREYYAAVNESVRIAQTRFSDWSNQQTFTVATDPTVPSAGTIAAAAADQAIDLTITPPTTNVGGGAINDLQGGEYLVYFDTTNAIDSTDSGTYSADAPLSIPIAHTPEVTRKTFPTSAKHYFIVTVTDRWGNTSADSAEVSATPTTAIGNVTIDDYADNFVQIVTGVGKNAIETQPPKSSWERWAGWKLYFDYDNGGGYTGSWTALKTWSGPVFVHKGLDQSYLYKYRLTVVGEDGTETSGTIDDNASAGYQPNAADDSNIIAVSIFAERIIADEFRGRTFTGGTFTGGIYQSTNLAAAVGTQLDAVNETLKFGGSGVDYDTGTGVFLGLHGGNYKFFVGDAAGNKLLIDPTGGTASFTGSLTITGGGLLCQSGGANVLYDPGMEQASTPYWGDNGARQAAGGENSNAWWKVTRSGSDLSDFARDHDGSIHDIEVNAGEVWEYGADLLSDGTCTARFTLLSLDKDKGGIAWATHLDSAAAAWTAKSGSYTIPATGKFLRVYVRAITADGWAGFDNCYLRRADLDWSFIQNVAIVDADITNLSASKINAGTLSAGYISGGTLDCSLMTVSNLNAGSITAGTLSVDRIAAGSITATQITGSALSDIYAALGSITSGTLTSALFRTAASGERAEVAPTGAGAHGFRAYRPVTGNLGFSAVYQGWAIYNSAGDEIGYCVNTSDYPRMALYGPKGFIGISQTSATGADEPLALLQADVDRGYIHFHGTAAAADITRSIVDYGDEASSSPLVWLKMKVTDYGEQVTDRAYYILGYELNA